MNKLNKILTVVLILAILATGVTAATSRKADLYYRDIKITLDGQTITPKDANGAIVDPFIIDGTTYLPVRAVSEALGLNVSWDDATSTVVLQSPGYTPPSTPTAGTVTQGMKNAVAKAQQYLKYSSFSRSGLISQLEFEGYSTSEVEYAVDNVGANWNEQAAKKAEQYLKYSSFSRSGLLDQLLFEGFTQSQAEYGLKAVGY